MVSKPQFAGLCLTGLLAGNELGTLVGFHPAILALPLRSQIESERALTRRLGKIMPFYMVASLAAAGTQQPTGEADRVRAWRCCLPERLPGWW